jgi:hypothetical protein
MRAYLLADELVKDVGSHKQSAICTSAAQARDIDSLCGVLSVDRYVALRDGAQLDGS